MGVTLCLHANPFYKGFLTFCKTFGLHCLTSVPFGLYSLFLWNLWPALFVHIHKIITLWAIALDETIRGTRCMTNRALKLHENIMTSSRPSKWQDTQRSFRVQPLRSRHVSPDTWKILDVQKCWDICGICTLLLCLLVSTHVTNPSAWGNLAKQLT